MDYSLLKNLRQVFLSGKKSQKSYWESRQLLELYDETFAARIGWKWDSVLKENCSNIKLPANYSLADWGAGSGVATRKFLSYFAGALPQEILLIEKSEIALQFAKQKIQEITESVPVTCKNKADRVPENCILLISHVLTEISEKEIADLIALAKSAYAVVWVEPGTPECSKQLIQVRKRLLESFRALSPCTHNETCPLLLGENSKDWCHHFAAVPAEAFTTEKWKTFSKELGIDLRSLPTSYLVMSKFLEAPATAKGRLIGRARTYKGYALAQVCSEKGLEEVKILEKVDKKLIKELSKTPFSRLF